MGYIKWGNEREGMVSDPSIVLVEGAPLEIDRFKETLKKLRSCSSADSSWTGTSLPPN